MFRLTAPHPVFRDVPIVTGIAVPAVSHESLILVCHSSRSGHHMCKSGTMCCSLRKAIFSKLQIMKENNEIVI